MFPCIFLTCLASIGQERLSIISNDNNSNNLKVESFLLSGINAFIALLLAIISYLKLDAVSEAHKISTHQYDKLQSFVEFQSGKLLLFNNNMRKISRKKSKCKKKNSNNASPTNTPYRKPSKWKNMMTKLYADSNSNFNSNAK